MDLEQAERHFQGLQAQRDRGKLDEEAFRVEVAKLLLRDDRGAFWMIDADSGTWFSNRGGGWIPGDPHTEAVAEAARPALGKAVRRRLGRVLTWGVIMLVLLGAVGAALLFRWPPGIWNPSQPLSDQDVRVNVAIASPADSSQVVLGQEVAIESTITATPDLQVIKHVELQVNGLTVDTRPVRPKIRPDQTSLPLSQLWRPTAAGEHQVTVRALSDEDVPLGMATITLLVTEASDEVLPEPACTPGATFIADVTIPAGTAFPPGAQRDKVWQVRNDGTCAWGVGYELVLIEGMDLGAPTIVPVPPTAAGEPADLAITFWAPVEAGTYSNVWQLRSPDGTFFGPTLTLSIEVEILAEESLPPTPPANLQAAVTDSGEAVRLTWEDRSNNEDAFRVYREDVDASIGLAPANAELFVDEGVTCGSIYRYAVVAFNASGASPTGETAEVAMSPCAPLDAPPSVMLTVVPTQVIASGTFTVVFQANDDIAVDMVVVWGVETGNAELDTGRIFTCTEVLCTGGWPITWTEEVSITLVVVAVARDSSGQESDPASMTVAILPPE